MIAISTDLFSGILTNKQKLYVFNLVYVVDLVDNAEVVDVDAVHVVDVDAVHVVDVDVVNVAYVDVVDVFMLMLFMLMLLMLMKMSRCCCSGKWCCENWRGCWFRSC